MIRREWIPTDLYAFFGLNYVSLLSRRARIRLFSGRIIEIMSSVGEN